MKRKHYILGALFVVVVFLDQLTKRIAIRTLVEGDPISVIPNLFNFTLVFNRGAAFGIFSTLPDTTRRIALTLVSLIALLVVFRFMFKEAKGDKLSLAALVAILAGAVGNLVDRFKYDAVVDFLDFYIGMHHWPAFNIADSAICLGVATLVLRVIYAKER